MDDIWVSTGVTVDNGCVMPVYYGLGDHQLFVVDFLRLLLIWLSPRKIVWHLSCCLNTRPVATTEWFLDKFEQNMIKHKLLKYISDAHEYGTPKKIIQERLDQIDEEGK